MRTVRSNTSLLQRVPLMSVAGQGRRFGCAAEDLVERTGQQLGVPVGVGHAVAGDRITVEAGVAHEGPARADREPVVVGEVPGPTQG